MASLNESQLAQQTADDRKKLQAGWGGVKDARDNASRAMADAATLIPRGLAGAIDSTVVRGARAAGLDVGYLSPKLVPDGVDPSSMTPYTDQKRMQQPGAGAGRGVVNPALADPAAPAPTVTAPAPTSGAAVGAGPAPSVNPPSANPAAAPPQPSAQEVAPGIYRTGNSYGDSPDAALAVRNQAPAQPSPRNMAAADALSAHSGRSLMGALAEQQQGNGAAMSLGGGDTRLADYANFAREANLNTALARMSPRRGAAVMAGIRQQDVSQNIEAMRGRNTLDQATLNNTGETQRVGMQQQGANQRSMMQAHLEQQRLGIQGRQADSQIAGQSAASKSTSMIAAMQSQIAQETDPAKRRALVQHLQDIQGGGQQADPRQNFMALGGGQEFDAASNAMRNVPQRLIDLRTGQEVGKQQTAESIKNDPNMTPEQKIEALKKAGAAAH